MTSSVIQRLIRGRAQNDLFVAAIEQAKQQSQQKKIRTTLVLIELRSSHYHLTGETGSETALDIASHLQASLRATDQVFPCGNWKVAILLPDTRIRDAVCLAERLRVQLNDFCHTYAAGDNLITSIGVAQGLGCESAQDWIRRTNGMCDHARTMGQSWVSFDPTSGEEQQVTELHATVEREARSRYRLDVISA